MDKHAGHALCLTNREMCNVKHPLLLTLFVTACLLTGTAACAECQIQLSEATIAYAPVTRGELLSCPGNSLTSSELRLCDTRHLDITVSCDRSTPITLAFNSAAKDSSHYRFGNGGQATLILHDVFIDNQPVTIDSAGQRGAEMAFTPGSTLRFWQNNAPALGRVLRGKVSITSWISSKETRVNEAQTWELNGAFVTGNAAN